MSLVIEQDCAREIVVHLGRRACRGVQLTIPKQIAHASQHPLQDLEQLVPVSWCLGRFRLDRILDVNCGPNA